MAGLAIASAVSSTVYALLLLLPLERRGEGVLGGGMTTDLLKMLAAAAVMGLCALFGLAVYFLMAVLLGLQEAKLVISLFTKRKRG